MMSGWSPTQAAKKKQAKKRKAEREEKAKAKAAPKAKKAKTGETPKVKGWCCRTNFKEDMQPHALECFCSAKMWSCLRKHCVRWANDCCRFKQADAVKSCQGVC